MAADSGLTAPGSSTYSSNTLHVGDGTWDSERDTFLLPNLMGINFDTMRYNGMGNRFKDMPEYHTLIVVHGVIATIVFLGLVPISILIVRYYSRWNPYWAFKLHVWCQVLTVMLSTVVFVFGWFAVGPRRSLTNPHHGIGLAIYVLVCFQVLWGWLVHKFERNKRRFHVPLKLVIHRWIGRALAILGIVQIPLGLTLYGSPKVLFILYAIAAFALLATWFVLSYLYDTEGYHMEGDFEARRSYVSGPSGHDGRPPGVLGPMAGAGAAGSGLGSLFRRRSRDKEYEYEDPHAVYPEEKFSDEGRRRGRWEDTMLKLGAIGGGAWLVKKFLDRKRDRDDDTESGRYSRAHARSDSMTEESLSRLEPTQRTPLNRPPSQPPSRPGSRPPGRPASRPQSPGSSYYYDSTYLSERPERRPSHTLRNAVLGAGAFAALKGLFSRRNKANDEQRRLEDLRRREMEDERLTRANSGRRYPGEAYYPRGRPESFTATDLSTELTRPLRRPSHGDSVLSAVPMASGAVDRARSDLPPASAPPVPHDVVSEAPAPPPPRHDSGNLAAGVATGAALGAAASSGHRHRSRSRRRDDHVDSPPVSVKLKMHNDGRHVTLRRLTDEEAAASREARRRERRNSRRRAGSASSLSGNEGGSYDRWRRVEELERQQQEQMQREQAAAAAGLGTSAAPSASIPATYYAPPPNASNLPPPPPPPVPSSHPYGAASITSPGTGTFTGTEASEYASNRRRRRAERARARQERQQGVEFT
ncbi:uncharacterized protein BP01DRAFT_388146 [Aspergillus saccharolyticus JOP 1030-1]|uniref:Cytochrome b561 domain-containing protein n=1 Tax=Aspergillus saccharolyticus JOP 1030-1 TaxID=1450539 RepID=A0A319A0S6_9EURO|nr:hypothetical protein BP01DRAFT_388146 [Aspergillus saccharolyticus JOP 1030-1]PYH50023.1 hypothetical protein BP01DRAFT_388146 [Aspergillus saccharolyticus JOP 1030-1]